MRTPMRRFGRVEELVGAAVYLASDAATFVTGQLLAVDGGFLAQRSESVNAVLVISERDNVATALEPLDAGARAARSARRRSSSAEAIPRGHKVALCAIRAGEPVVKYGSPIGTRVGGHRRRRARAHAQRRERPRTRRSSPAERRG